MRCEPSGTGGYRSWTRRIGRASVSAPCAAFPSRPTTFAEVEPYPQPQADEEAVPARDYIRTTTAAFRFVHSESLERIGERGAGLEDLLDEGLAVALSDLLKRA
jgi:hypothetical protein